MISRLALFIAAIGFSLSANAQSIEEQALDWLQAFIRIDTINPPGNESRAVDFIAGILESEGIAYQTAESAPGRGNTWTTGPRRDPRRPGHHRGGGVRLSITPSM